MKKLFLICLLLILVLSGCSSKISHGVVVGKNIVNHNVDIKLDNGDVRSLELSPEQFYSGNFEVGQVWNISCIFYNCSPISKG